MGFFKNILSNVLGQRELISPAPGPDAQYPQQAEKWIVDSNGNTVPRLGFKGTPTPETAPVSPSSFNELKQVIDRGISKFSQGAGQEVPLATLSAQLAQAGGELSENSKVDPYMPTIMALMESRGLLDPKPAAASNPYNIMNGGLVNYPTPEVAILGGGDQLGFKGLLRNQGLYQKYRDTGNLKDFFGKFTPSSDPLNPSQNELIQRYNTLRANFN